MKALCIPGTFSPKDYGGKSEQVSAQWTVLTFDDATAARLAALYQPNPSEGAGLDPNALEAR